MGTKLCYRIMRQEINLDLHLSESKRILLDFHSLFNLFNILHIEIERLIEQSKIPYLLPFSGMMVSVLECLLSTNKGSKIEVLENGLRELMEALTKLKSEFPEYSDSVEALEIVIEMGFLRVDELKKDRFIWRDIPLLDLEQKLCSFLAATERVSRNRFHFVYPPNTPINNEYLIEFQFEVDGNTVFAPLVVHDVIRDLAANSRKYSKPGSKITVLVSQTESNGISLKIRDEGMGIPKSEFEEVVKYKRRASNTKNIKTMGKGFGLTKAYHLCKIHNGKFVIDSEIGKGTTIEMTMYPIHKKVLERPVRVM